MNLLRSSILFLILCWSSISILAKDVEREEISHGNRQKRQLGSAIFSAVNDLKWRLNAIGLKIDSYVLPKVQFASEKIKHQIAPSIVKSVKDFTNKVVLNAAQKLQEGAQYFNEEVAPVIEDKVVALSNAAVPIVNKGIDAMETGLHVGVNAVTKTTTNGIKQIGQNVLGEQRHSRIKKIANNISVNFNNSINTLAGKIKKVTEDDEYKHGLSFVDITSPSQVYTRYKQGYPPNYYSIMPNTLTSSNSLYAFNQGDKYSAQSSTTNTEADMTMPEALKKLMSNTVYAVSKQLLGPNLTAAIAPIARSVSDNVGSNLPEISSGNQIATEPPEKLRSCTTPEGDKGFCQDLQDCPNLVLKMSILRRSICFKRVFSPGVCCPDVGQLKTLRDAQAAQVQAAHAAQAAQVQAAHAAQAQAAQAAQAAGPILVNSAGVNYLQHPGFPGQQNTLPQHGLTSPVLAHPGQQLLYGNHVQQPSVLSSNLYVANDLFSRDNIIINKHYRNNEYDCGRIKVPQFRIVGGEKAFIGEWPWTAAIYLHGKKKTEFWCGGSLISENFILTASHCTKDSNQKTFNPDQFSVHLGDYDIFNEEDDRVSKPEIYRVRYILPHPEFRRHGYFNDIALIKLSRTVEFSPYILPVCLPPESIERSPLDALEGQTPSVIGYGSTHYDGPQSNALRDVQLPIWKNSDCDKAYFQPITDIFICAGYAEGGKDACQGDSGGPMMLFYQGRWIQLGIVSFGNRCAEPGYPGVYTRITQFLPWIRQNMR